MATVGGITCTYVRGHLPDNRQRVRTWAVSGLNGYGAKRTGLGDSEWWIEVEWKSTSTGANTFYAAIEALQGQIVTIVNDWGNTFTNCLVTKVGPPQKTAELGYGGARMRCRIEGVRK